LPMVAAVMLGLFLPTAMKAAEPLLPLSLFRDSVITICSIANFVLGIGMFGVIIYLSLFMQVVLVVSATHSGALLMALMLAAGFGSLFLTIYKRDFASSIPPGTPQVALEPFTNPLLLDQLRPQLEAAFGRYPDGPNLLHTLMGGVRASLVHGLQVIFVVGAVI